MTFRTIVCGLVVAGLLGGSKELAGQTKAPPSNAFHRKAVIWTGVAIGGAGLVLAGVGSHRINNTSCSTNSLQQCILNPTGDKLVRVGLWTFIAGAGTASIGAVLPELQVGHHSLAIVKKIELHREPMRVDHVGAKD
jgi:hypothetical protein